MTDQIYIGDELHLFAHAVNWKKYYGKLIKPYLGSRVLEVGAGMGATSLYLMGDEHEEWVCLEPDKELRSQIDDKIEAGALPSFCKTIGGFTYDLSKDEKFDVLIYIDVLEHIEHDSKELETAVSLLKPGGKIISISPALQYLFSPFDQAIGHYRRYDKKMMKAITLPNLSIVQLKYLDSVGLLSSLANKWVLKQGSPTLPQIKFWDRVQIPISRVVDYLIRYKIGRSLLCIWQKHE